MSENERWRVLRERKIYSQLPWLEVIEQDVQLPNGVIIERYVLAPQPDVALIVPVTTTGQLVFVRQYKHGVGDIVWDLPAGYMDAEDESPLAAAKRELLEETGYGGGEWISLGRHYHDTNRSRRIFNVFLALGVRSLAAPTPDETETLTVACLDWPQVADMVRRNEIETMDTIAALGMASWQMKGWTVEISTR